MSPIAVEPDFTRKYLQSSNNEALVKTIQKAFEIVSPGKRILFSAKARDMPAWVRYLIFVDAQVAKILGTKVIM